MPGDGVTSAGLCTSGSVSGAPVAPGQRLIRDRRAVDGPRTRRCVPAPQKRWWSLNFAGGSVKSIPEIAVTHERLDEDGVPPTVDSPGTNAYTVDYGWFMIGGIDPQTPGCWRVTAEYRGASLSYVYEID